MGSVQKITEEAAKTEGPEQTLTIYEVAKLLQLHPVYLRRHLAHGRFPGAIRIGKVWRIPLSAYKAVLKNGLAGEVEVAA